MAVDGLDALGLFALAFDLKAAGDPVGCLPVPLSGQAFDLAPVYAEGVELQAQEGRAQQAKADEGSSREDGADQPAGRAKRQEALQHPLTPLRYVQITAMNTLAMPKNQPAANMRMALTMDAP